MTLHLMRLMFSWRQRRLSLPPAASFYGRRAVFAAARRRRYARRSRARYVAAMMPPRRRRRCAFAVVLCHAATFSPAYAYFSLMLFFIS
jgi:hypothetical protein